MCALWVVCCSKNDFTNVDVNSMWKVFLVTASGNDFRLLLPSVYGAAWVCRALQCHR